MDTWTQVTRHAADWLAEYRWRSLAGLAILLMGLLLALVSNAIFRWVSRRRAISVSRSSEISRTTVLLAISLTTAILILSALGVAGPVIGFVVTLGIAVGVFSDSLGGLRILLARPFKVGDLLEVKDDGLAGYVERITIIGIVLVTKSGSRVIISNRKPFEAPIINHSETNGESPRCFQIVLSSEKNFEVLEEAVRSAASKVPGFVSGHGCTVRLCKVEAEAITLTVEYRVALQEEGDTTTVFLSTAKSALEKLGIGIQLIEAQKS